MNSAQIIDAIRNLSLKQCVELRDALAESLNLGELNLSTRSRDEGVAPPVTDSDSRTEFSVRLESIGPSKIQVISTIRQSIGLALGAAKTLVESAPALVLENVSKEEALALKAKLEAAGAVVSLV